MQIKLRRKETEVNNVFSYAMPQYDNVKKMRKGIENALNLNEIDLEGFFSEKIKEGDYGDDNRISEFNKMACCEYICGIENNDFLKSVFENLKREIDKILEYLQ